MAPQEHFRAQARRRVELPVLLRTVVDRVDRRAILVDLGLVGACLELEEALVLGGEVILEVRSPLLWDPLHLRGEVVWARWDTESGLAHAGVHFQHDTSSTLFSLFEFLSSQGFET